MIRSYSTLEHNSPSAADSAAEAASSRLIPKYRSTLGDSTSHTKMSLKCVHKGCGKKFSNPEDDCVYHPGPPIFHEGQKGVRILFHDNDLSPEADRQLNHQVGNAASPEFLLLMNFYPSLHARQANIRPLTTHRYQNRLPDPPMIPRRQLQERL